MIENKKFHLHQLLANKTFKEGNLWVEKKEKTPIILCKCGVRYIKTREEQKGCLLYCWPKPH